MWAMMSKRLMYGYVFMGGVLILCYHFSGIMGCVKFLWIFIAYFFVVYLVYWIVKTGLQKEAIKISHFFILYVYKLSVFLSFFLVVCWGFIYYQNDLNPAKMPLYTLSNWEKTIRFQAMSHIAQESFYEGVQKSIAQAKNDGYVLFYEWVRPGSSKNEKIFQEALGVKISPDLYEQFSNIYGVSHQKNDDFLNIRNDLDFNIDLNINTIVSLYLKKLSPEDRSKYDTPPETLSLLGKKRQEISDDSDTAEKLFQEISQLDEQQLKIVRYINKSFLNFIIKHDSLRNFIISKLNIDDIFTVILDDRNEHIVAWISSSKYSEIFAMYGLMHFDGILWSLQDKDPSWEIIETSYSYPISLPDSPINRFLWW